jgi:hypothetical protein
MSADPFFKAPIFIISPPRSGSTLLFETLAQAPNLFTVGGESHRIIEGLGPLTIDAHNFDSNRLDENDATPPVVNALRQRFASALRDRNGVAPREAPARMLEKTPKNALRIPFLVRVFPEARFIYLHREPAQTLNSMIEAWLSGRFRTYPDLPGWPSPPTWSLLLTPGWRQSVGKPLPQIVAAQYSACVTTLLDDLERIAPERRLICRYQTLAANWGAEIERICAAFGLDWDRPLTGPLPHSRYTVSAPDPEKWRSRAADINPMLDAMGGLLERIDRFVTTAPPSTPQRPA